MIGSTCEVYIDDVITWGAVYPKAYKFFEKLRILNGEPKTTSHLRAEREHPDGYNLYAAPKRIWVNTNDPNWQSQANETLKHINDKHAHNY
jgi:hypothetical protein